MDTTKNKRGRKNKYDTHVKPRLKDIENWCRDGKIDSELCKRLGVSLSKFQEYKKEFKELTDTLKRGKQEADYEVENSLYKRALGYENTETKRIKNESGKIIRTEILTKQMPADVTACIFWLKNRKSNEWRDKRDQDIQEDVKITVTLMNNED